MSTETEIHPGVERPDESLAMSEGLRAMADLGELARLGPLLANLPSGDGHPVLVIPGFTADDSSTRLLRRFLESKAYAVHGWGQGPNLGPTDEAIDGLRDRMQTMQERHGRTVSIIGWSLGGNFAREIARLAPDRVRGVITLGSPFRMRDPELSTLNPMWRRLRPLHRARPNPPTTPILEDDRPKVPVPNTAIYTRGDGVVPWQLCIEPRGETAESVEVRASHSGLGFHPAVWIVIADRLAQPEGTWRPFAPLPQLAAMYPLPKYHAAG